jgi:cyclopropane-fatty-acyl-phospholipid synthase
VRGEKTLRAYRLYLAGSAMSFERGWLSLHQMLATRPAEEMPDEKIKGARGQYPFRRDYMYTGSTSGTGQASTGLQLN